MHVYPSTSPATHPSLNYYGALSFSECCLILPVALCCPGSSPVLLCSHYLKPGTPSPISWMHVGHLCSRQDWKEELLPACMMSRVTQINARDMDEWVKWVLTPTEGLSGWRLLELRNSCLYVWEIQCLSLVSIALRKKIVLYNDTTKNNYTVYRVLSWDFPRKRDPLLILRT